MIRIIRWIGAKLLFLWSLMPCLSLTIDNNFGSIELNENNEFKAQLWSWRISLLQLMLGKRKIYFFTFGISNSINFKSRSEESYNRKFQVIRVISLENLFDIFEYSNNIANTYKNRIFEDEFSEKRLLSEKESLVYHIETEEKRIDKSDNKINIYSSIILAAIPIAMALINYSNISSVFHFPQIYILFIFLYSLLNFFAYISQYIKVGKYSRSKFCDIKDEVTKTDKMLTYQYYYDYQSLKTKADMFVSYVLNIQRWFIILSVSLMLLILCLNTWNDEPNIIDSNTCDYSLTIMIDDLNNIHSNSSIEVTKVNLLAQTEEIESVTILWNGNSNLDVFNERLADYLDDVTVHYIIDNELSINEVKIIVYGGKAK